jgi:hypothetical protein
MTDWWLGIRPTKLSGFEWERGKKAHYNGTLAVTERAGLKDKGDARELGLYYHETLGGSLWIPFRVVKKIEWGEAELHKGGIGFIGFGPIGIAAVVGARAVNAHRAKGTTVRVIAVTDGQKTHRFQTKASGERVTDAFGAMFTQYEGVLQATAAQEAERADNLRVGREAIAQRAAEAMAAAVIPPQSVADELTKLVGLRDAGVLTDEEFAAQKARLLS